jgi:glycerol-3-phosphate dehydrogenase
MNEGRPGGRSIRNVVGIATTEGVRLVRAYGSEAARLLGDASTVADLGRDFGATLTEAEVRWLMAHEFAQTAADVVWQRSKLGLRMTADQISDLDRFMIANAKDAALSRFLPASRNSFDQL